MLPVCGLLDSRTQFCLETKAARLVSLPKLWPPTEDYYSCCLLLVTRLEIDGAIGWMEGK